MASRPRRAAAGAAKSSARPPDVVLNCIAGGTAVRRTEVASLIAMLDASAIARSLSLYTSRSTAPTSAGVGWRCDMTGTCDEKRIRVAKQCVNAVLMALQSHVRACQARSAPPTDTIPVLIDCFRISMGVLCTENVSLSQMAPVALSVVRQLVDLTQHDKALTELVALHACLAGTGTEAVSVHEPGDARTRLLEASAFSLDGAGQAVSTPWVLDTCALLMTCAAALADVPTLQALCNSAAPWMEHARQSTDAPIADRTAYAAERAAAQVLGTARPTLECWQLRTTCLCFLAPAKKLDLAAFWDRVLSVSMTHARATGFASLCPQLSALWQQSVDGPTCAARDKWIAWCDDAAHTHHVSWRPTPRQDDEEPEAPPHTASASEPSSSAVQAAIEALATASRDPTALAAVGPSLEALGAPSTVPPALWPALDAALRAVVRAAMVPMSSEERAFLVEALRLLACNDAASLPSSLHVSMLHAARHLTSAVFAENQPDSHALCMTALLHASTACPKAMQHHMAALFFHYGSRLYAARRYAPASQYVAEACRVALLSDPDAPGTEPLQVLRQYQVLGGARQHLSDHAGAYDAYLAGWSHAGRTALTRASASTLRLSDPALAPMAKIAVAAHHISVFGLLQPSRFLDELQSLPPHARGAVLEHLADALEPMLPRDETPAALDLVLHEALDTYTVTHHPLERARVLCRRAELQLLRHTAPDWADMDACWPHVANDTPAGREVAITYHALQCWAAVLVEAYDEAAQALERIEPVAPRSVPRTRVRSGRARAPAPRRWTAAEPPRTPPRDASPDEATVACRPTHDTPVRSLGTLLLLLAEVLQQAGLVALQLRVLRLAVEQDPVPCDAPARLCEAWLALGAYDAVVAYMDGDHLSPSSPRALLVHAQVHAWRNDVTRATHAYEAAIDAAETTTPKTPAWNRLGQRATLWDLQARAADVYVTLCMTAGHGSMALAAQLHALRVRLRAVTLLCPSPTADSDVFGTSSESSAVAHAPSLTTRHLAMLHARLAHGLHTSYAALSAMYAKRGAVRDADAFASECVDFSATRGVPLVYAAALAWRADWRAASGAVESAWEDVAQASALVHGQLSEALPRLAIVAAELQGDSTYGAARDQLAQLAVACDVDRIWPDLHQRLACGEARACMDSDAERALTLLAPWESTSAAQAVMAQVWHARAHAALGADAVYGMLPEVAWSVPSVPISMKRVPTAVRTSLPLWERARAAANRVLKKAEVADVRDVRVALELLRDVVLTTSAITRPASIEAVAQEAHALTDAAVSVSVRRARADAHVLVPAKQAWCRWPPPPSSSEAVPDAASLAPGTGTLVVALSQNQRDLILARESPEYGTSVFTIPIDRQSRREGDEEAWDVHAVLHTLRELVQASNAGVQSAKDVGTALEARKAWWEERRALDAQLAQLLETVQTTWLGAFQGLFAPLPPPNAIEALATKLDAIIGRACAPHSRSHTTSPVLALPRMSVACLAAMPSYRDEDLEDWVHYAMDALQLSGAPVAQDEMDVDELVVDVRSALDEYHVRQASAQAASLSETHLCLVLDRGLCELPWESLPVLRARSVSRLTGLALIPPLRTLDRARTTFLLNPSGDLVRSEARFAPALRAEPTWRGTVGHAPVDGQVAQSLANSDTFLYVGHAGAEMYVHPIKLRELRQCAAAMLWGCSSGALRAQGAYDPVGTPYHYAVAQCPALLAALWDTTDRELDGVCEAVLRLVGLLPGAPRTEWLSLPRAVAAARTECKLPYLTGAACVVYGAPVCWQ
ncbi:separase [Malassezia nana]|uniref:separase n=1 Tax=Malassezia nana TaxID=180528 RepID=A0AAF0EIK2_9BASI|nr:separase [Malassezia nana]